MTGPECIFMDEADETPLRTRVGDMMAGADTADFAVARIRLAHLDLQDHELGALRKCRVLLGQLDAATLLDAADPGPPRAMARSLQRLARFAAGGRLEVRSTGRPAWTPDFAVLRSASDATAIVGAIYFGSPQLVVGPSFTVIFPDPAAAGLLGQRFEALWARAHDVLPAIREALEHANAMAVATATGSGDADPERADR